MVEFVLIQGEHYAAIKKKCVIESPIPSQCITSTVLNKPKGLMSVATKVAIQMNCKLGGEPWAVQIPMKDTMIIGKYIIILCLPGSHGVLLIS